MAGYLDSYGVADERREKLVKRIVIVTLSAIIIVSVLYFSFRTHGQEKVMSQFFQDLEQQKYQEAYKLWGCPENCKYYPPDKFLEDWGPKSPYGSASAFKIQHIDYCDEGVVFDVTYPKAPEDVGLWVNRSTDFISFNPTPRCPGRHLQLGAFFHNLFS
ncbi:MAG TPA: hypothetical protein VGG72_32730 [Bryobacteraceae bacterium]|jgi:hypothetical protein